MFGLLPHSPIILSEVRPLDIWLLLGIGMVWELVSRGILLLVYKKKSSALVKKESELEIATRKTEKLQKMGPSKFVETSKMERSCLALEREVTTMKEQRKISTQSAEKILGRDGNMAVAALVFLLFYGVPIMTLAAVDDNQNELLSSLSIEEDAGASLTTPPPQSLRAIMFPISYIGMGMRVARWGLEDINNSMGGLVVMWSGQVFIGKLMDAADALLLVL
eukprot:CAMPEP_0198140648 /NCGR_PEP_ID=MMETSP1443-20131203/3785_1 /TAXON_ID=186043 /ORGANISM="Entomoneis sp., Strain CCMP2396" /LENGTH=220 /DNA_ID=CAMNT_0043803147 /DNA_START=206 /DNA_END=871 /DNA_ORIENTATION=+